MPRTAASIANAMVNKGAVLNQLNRTKDALNMYDDMLLRFGSVRGRAVQGSVETALTNKGITLGPTGPFGGTQL